MNISNKNLKAGIFIFLASFLISGFWTFNSITILKQETLEIEKIRNKINSISSSRILIKNWMQKETGLLLSKQKVSKESITLFTDSVTSVISELDVVPAEKMDSLKSAIQIHFKKIAGLRKLEAKELARFIKNEQEFYESVLSLFLPSVYTESQKLEQLEENQKAISTNLVLAITLILLSGLSLGFTCFLFYKQRILESSTVSNKYFQITENSTDIIVRHDVSGEISFISPAFERWTGYPIEEIKQTGLFSFIKDEDLEKLKEDFHAAHFNDENIYSEVQLKNQNGSYTWFEINSNRCSDDSNLIQSSWREIEERKIAENTIYLKNQELETLNEILKAQINERINLQQKLKREKELSSSIIDNSPIGIAALDKDWNVTLWNKAMENITGLSESKVAGNGLSTIFPLEKGSEEHNSFRMAFRGKTIFFKEKVLFNLPGIYESFILPLYDEQNEISGVVALINDITERKGAENKLQENKHFIEKLAYSNPNHIYVYDCLSSKNIYSNRSLNTFLGFEVNGVDDVIATINQNIFDDDRLLFNNYITRIKNNNNDNTSEIQFRIKNESGEILWLSAESLVFKRNEAGECEQLMITLQDISSDRESKEQIEFLYQLTEAINESPNFNQALKTTLSKVCERTGWAYGEAWICDENENVRLAPEFYCENDSYLSLYQSNSKLLLKKDEGMAGRVLKNTIEWLTDFSSIDDEWLPGREQFISLGFIAAIGVPVAIEGRVLASLQFYMRENSRIDIQFTKMVCSVASQLGAVLQRKKIEEELKQSQFFINQVASSIPNWIYVLDVNEGKYIYSNFYLSKMLGYSEFNTEAENNIFQNALHQDDFKLMTEKIWEVCQAENEQTVENQFRLLDKNGSIKWINSRSTVFKRNENGVVTHILGTANDITARKEAEEKAKESSRFIEKVANISPSVIAVYNVNTQRFDYINEYISNVLGYDKLIILDQGVSFIESLIHPEDKIIVQEKTLDALKLANADKSFHQVVPFEYRIKNKCGEWRWITTYWTVFDRDKDGFVSHVLNISVDVTEQKLTEQNLIKKEELLKEAQDMANLGSWEWDVLQNKIHWSDELYRIFGFKPGEFDLNYENFLDQIHPDDLSYVKNEIEQAFATGKPYTMEHRITTTSGEVKTLLGKGKVLKNKDGDTVKIYGSTLDITELKNTTEQLKKKDEFIGIASHELKTPLTSIKAYVQLLDKYLHDKSDDTSKLYLSKANIFIDKLNQLIVDLLDVSRIQAGKMQFNMDEFNFSELVKEIVDNMQHVGNKHKIILEGNTEQKIYGDKQRLEQVFTNIISNAIKYSPEETEVKVDVFKKENEILVAIKDQGIGIPNDKLEKIFERFYRVENLPHKFTGLGIGLYISYEIIRRHNGRAWVESEEGKGSVFYFSLPILNKEENSD